MLSDDPPALLLEEEDSERGDMAFLKDLLSPGPGSSDEFSREWQDAFGMFDPPSVAPAGAGMASSGQAACLPSDPPSPTGFLPSQLLDHSLSSTGQKLCLGSEPSAQSNVCGVYLFTWFDLLGWSTPPMFQAPPMQHPGPNQSAQPTPSSAANGKDFVWVINNTS